MAWVRLDDNMADHPKIVGLSDGAFRAFVAGLCYCNRHLTDGCLPAGFSRRKLSTELVANGLWIATETGFTIHDYLEYQPSKEHAQSVSQKRSDAGRAGGLAKANGKQSASNLSSKSEAKVKPVPVPVPKENKNTARERAAQFDEIYSCWMNQPAVVQHRQPTDLMRRHAAAAVKNHTLQGVLDSIALYATVLASAQHFFSYSWPLDEFLQRGVPKFLPETNPLTRFYGQAPGTNGAQQAERKPAADRQAEDAVKCRRMFDRYTSEGMTKQAALDEVRGIYPDEIIDQAIQLEGAA